MRAKIDVLLCLNKKVALQKCHKNLKNQHSHTANFVYSLVYFFIFFGEKK